MDYSVNSVQTQIPKSGMWDGKAGQISLWNIPLKSKRKFLKNLYF